MNRTVHIAYGAGVACGRDVADAAVEDVDARYFAYDGDLADGYRYCRQCAAKHNDYASRYGEISQDSLGFRYCETAYGSTVLLSR